MDSRNGRLLRAATPWLVGTGMFVMALDVEAEGPPARLATALVASVGIGLALRWRYLRPELAAATVLGLSAAYHALVPEVIVPFAGLVAVFAFARCRRPRQSLFGLAGLVAVCAINFAVATLEDALFTVAMAACAWALGEAARSRREAIRQATLGAVRDEQARIARELHDVIAHSVTVMVVQASPSGDVFDRRPDQARVALGSIERVGRGTLGELRRLLGAVRDEATTTPQPGLARIDDLVSPLRTTGFDVAVVEVGAPVPLPAGVDVSAYRIVQEALTNTVRHARATAASITVRYEPDSVEIDVLDDGHPAPHRPGSGYGIVGMRERAALLGGTFDAGPTAHGGFRVRARLRLAAPG